MNYEERVRQYEAEGMTRSDAQAVADAEDMRRTTLNIQGTDWTVSADELQPELAEALKACGRPGQDASDAVEYVRANWEITAAPPYARAYLEQFGCWNEEELANHQENIDRLVWIIGCDLSENGEAYLSTY